MQDDIKDLDLSNLLAADKFKENTPTLMIKRSMEKTPFI